MTITASDIKIGMCIEMDNKTFLVVDFQLNILRINIIFIYQINKGLINVKEIKITRRNINGNI